MNTKIFLPLLLLVFTMTTIQDAYTQEKPRIGVLRFTSQVDNAYLKRDGVAIAQRILLVSLKDQYGAESIVDYTRIKGVSIEEGDLFIRGYKSPAEFCKQHGIDFLIVGTIEEYRFLKKGPNDRMTFRGKIGVAQVGRPFSWNGFDGAGDLTPDIPRESILFEQLLKPQIFSVVRKIVAKIPTQ